MTKTYNINLSAQGIGTFQEVVNKIETLLSDDKFIKYIADKCQTELKRISDENTFDVRQTDVDYSTYASSHQMEIVDDTIYLFNDSKINIAGKIFKNPETRANYPLTLSLAKIVEWGIGYTGLITATETPLDKWQYDVNGHGYQGWYYENQAGDRFWTNGFEGRLIYSKLKLAIKDNIRDWIKDYILKYI